jgi:hypothetical protein
MWLARFSARFFERTKESKLMANRIEIKDSDYYALRKRMLEDEHVGKLIYPDEKIRSGVIAMISEFLSEAPSQNVNFEITQKSDKAKR